MSYFQQMMAILAGGGGGSPASSLANGWHSLKFLGGGPTLLAAGRTYVGMITSRAPFTKARLTFLNYQTTPLVLVADVAASPTMSATGAGLTHIPVTVGGSTTITVPAATSVGGQIAPGCVRSDEINVASVPRTDVVGADPVFYHRIYSAQQMPSWGFNFNDAANVMAGASGRYGHASGVAFNGNAVGTNTEITLYTSPGNFTQVAQIDLYCPGEQSCDAILFGDSLSAGAYNQSFTWDLFRLFNGTPRKSMALANVAVGGNTRDTTSAAIRSVGAAARPTLALLWNLTVNSPGSTQAEVDAQWASVLDDVAFLQAQGCNVGLVTMHGRGPVGNALIAGNNARTRAWCAANNVLLVDFAAAVADPAGINDQIHDDYAIFDWTHLELAGVQRGAEFAFAPALTSRL